MSQDRPIVVLARPLESPEAFSPYGAILTGPDLPGPLDYSHHLRQRNPDTEFSLKLLKRAASATPVVPPYLERHPFSDQFFIPVSGGSYLSLVAPTMPDGEPDLDRLAAFRIAAPAAIVYAANVWHAPIAVTEGDGLFVTLMWSKSAEADTEKRVTARPIHIACPGAGTVELTSGI
jgi:ureidoglycolate lyase